MGCFHGCARNAFASSVVAKGKAADVTEAIDLREMTRSCIKTHNSRFDELTLEEQSTFHSLAAEVRASRSYNLRQEAREKHMKLTKHLSKSEMHSDLGSPVPCGRG